jgi:hypothetical protein
MKNAEQIFDDQTNTNRPKQQNCVDVRRVMPPGADKYSPFGAFNELLAEAVVRSGEILLRGSTGLFRGAATPLRPSFSGELREAMRAASKHQGLSSYDCTVR